MHELKFFLEGNQSVFFASGIIPIIQEHEEESIIELSLLLDGFVDVNDLVDIAKR